MTALTPEERVFRAWMLVSLGLYGIAGVFFLFWGDWVPRYINAFSARFLNLPLYPESEGAFWRVLSISMMAMITWIVLAVYHDLHANRPLVSVLLLSKCCSTGLYAVFFMQRHELLYLVGALTDGPLFLITWALWYAARPGARCLDRKEEQILLVLGEAMLPGGGAFPAGYGDVAEACLADLRRLVSAQQVTTRLFIRVALRTLDLLPILLTLRPHTLGGVPLEERSRLLAQLETHWFTPFRLLLLALKTHTVLPFFNQPSVARAIGYEPETRMRP
jgi:hypothetical protein